MKMMIDIPDDIYNHIVVDSEYFTPSLVNAFKNGIPIPDNATNGNSVIKIFFSGIVRVNSRKNVSVEFNKDWWNAPYQKGGKE